MLSLRILILSVLVVCHAVLGSVNDNLKKGLHLDFGAIQTHVQDRLESSSEYEKLVGTLSGYLRIRGSLPVGKKWVWEPSFGMLVPWKSGPDGSTKKFNNQVDFTFSYPFYQWLRIRLGPGIHWGLSFSDGGAVVLNNGTSTSTFYTPGYLSQNFTVTAQTGLSFILSSKLSLNLEVYGSGLLDQLRRNFDLAATLGWRI